VNSTARQNILKNVLFVFILLFLYVLQSVPGLFVIYGVKPFLTIPAAIAIAMFEGEFAGGVYGAVAGLLCDMGGLLLFGYNGFITAACCIAAGLLIIHLIRCNIFAFLLFAVFTMMLRGTVEYFFAYGMWNHLDASRIFLSVTLPTALYSVIAGIPLFFLLRGMHRRFPVPEGDEV